ncbi:synapse differentiation-inducing gene protein 1-like [Ruditapes philippinarum]|uniref:synapse differentiation-inducing gene protein 1-like n=1 Tax=Ruditapes philippinarum TaxID=129788 RepID=UPI00295B698B|nr:synapse differentiation-inducing gene protein 1-like [Ruditapes philippinarum]
MTDGHLQKDKGVWHTNSEVSDLPSINYDAYGEEEVLDELQGPRSWVVPAIASTVFCFLPTGLIALYYARKAQKAYETGDFHSWTRYRGRARFLIFVTCVLGILVYIVIIAIVQGIKHTSST